MTTKTIRTSPFNPVDYLKTDDDIAAYLEAALEEDEANPAFLKAVLADVVRAKSSISKVSREAGISREGLYKALSETGNPTIETLSKVANAVGYRITLKRISAEAAA